MTRVPQSRADWDRSRFYEVNWDHGGFLRPHWRVCTFEMTLLMIPLNISAQAGIVRKKSCGRRARYSKSSLNWRSHKRKRIEERESRNMEKTRFRMAILGCIVLAAQIAVGQTGPAPEFFGIYASVDGKLAPLFGGRGSFTPQHHDLEVFNINSMRAETLTVFSLDGTDMRITVFDPAIADTSANIELFKLPFARSLETQPDVLGQVTGILGPSKSTTTSMQKYVLAKTDALRIELLQKPISGQPQMIQLVPASALEPGLYSVFAVRSQGGQQMVFGVMFEWNSQSGEPAKPYCIDLKTTGGIGGAMDDSDARMMHPFYLAKEKYAECGTTSSSSSGIGSSGRAACGGYDGCFNAGIKAYGEQNSAETIVSFQAAVKADPTKGEAWKWLGISMLQGHQVGQVEQLASVWDKALSLGSTITISACHERGFQSCERGDLNLSPAWISFSLGDTQLFNVPPKQIEPGRIMNNPSGGQVSYSLKAGGKNYNFDFIPSTWATCTFNQMVQCPQEGNAEQLILSQYVSQTIPKLAQGFGTPASFTHSPAGPDKPVVSRLGLDAQPSR